MSDAPETGSDRLPTSPMREHAAPAPQQPSEREQMSERDILAGIEGLLEAEEQPRKRAPRRAAPVATETRQQDLSIESGGPEPPEPGPEEVTGDEGEEPEEPDDGGEEPDPSDHPIDPPVSWSKEEKALFQQLPPEAQQVIARRESERDKAFTQKTQEVAEHRKAVEATYAAIQSERGQYAQNLQQLLLVAMPEAEQFAQIDWQRLAQESPADYVKLTAQRDALRGRIGAIQGELGRVSQQQEQDKARNFASLKQSEAQRLAEKLPVFADKEKGPKFVGELRSYLQEQGFAAEEIGQVIDHRAILIAEKAMRLDRMTQARRSAETRRSDPAPIVQRPGSTQGRETQIGRRREQKFQQLRRSGSQQDALSYLMEIL